MSDDLQRWVLELKAAEAKLVPGEIIRLQKTLTFLALGAAVELAPGRFHRISGVVLLTPVDTGRARSSWNVSVGEPSRSVPPPGRQRSHATPATARGALAGLGAYETVWISSSLPYIHVLEFGLYPNPPQFGSWDRAAKRYIIKSAGGYSKQAPRGMVRITVAQLERALRSL